MAQTEPNINEFIPFNNTSNSVDVDASAIYLFDDIDKYIAKEIWSKGHILDDPRSKEPIRVYINSNGGDVDAMNSILAFLDNCQTEIHVHVTGTAASAAAIISLVGTKIYMSKYATIMFHCYSISLDHEKQQDASHYVKNAKEIHDRAIRHLLKKRGINFNSFVKNYEKSDWYISPEQALKLKLIDGVF